MNFQERSTLRRRLKRASKDAEREYIKLQRRELFDLDEDARDRWALLFQAFKDVTRFDFEQEAD